MTHNQQIAVKVRDLAAENAPEVMNHRASQRDHLREKHFRRLAVCRLEDFDAQLLHECLLHIASVLVHSLQQACRISHIFLITLSLTLYLLM